MIFQVLYRVEVATGKVTPLTDRIPQSVHDFCGPRMTDKSISWRKTVTIRPFSP